MWPQASITVATRLLNLGNYALSQMLLPFIIKFLIRHHQVKCTVATGVCVCACLSLAVFPHHCTYPDVTLGNGRAVSYTHLTLPTNREV